MYDNNNSVNNGSARQGLFQQKVNKYDSCIAYFHQWGADKHKRTYSKLLLPKNQFSQKISTESSFERFKPHKTTILKKDEKGIAIEPFCILSLPKN